MSDSSEDEDLSRFIDVIDTSFNKLINESRGIPQAAKENSDVKPKSERYLEEASHYNDVKVPAELQKRIGAKVSEIIHKNVKFVDIDNKSHKKRKIKGGVKLFKGSDGFLSCEEVKDTYTENHNMISKKIKKKRRQIDAEDKQLSEDDKLAAATVNGDYILSKDETKCWKSRRKEKLFQYKGKGKSKVLNLVP